MKNIINLLFLFIFLSGCSDKKVADKITTLCIIGTQHESNEYINPEKTFIAIECFQPDIILCELESKYFNGNTYNLKDFPDLLSTNENIATYQYQQKYNIDLHPYEIEGRNDYYKDNSFFEKQQELFSIIMTNYQNKSLSEKSYKEWDIFLKAVKLLDITSGHSLEEINSALYVRYAEAKDMLLHNTFISIAKRDFPDKLDNAKELKNFWDKRNRIMCENILKWCKVYKGKRIVVLTGQQHKSQILNRINLQTEKYNLVIKDFWEK